MNNCSVFLLLSRIHDYPLPQHIVSVMVRMHHEQAVLDPPHPHLNNFDSMLLYLPRYLNLPAIPPVSLLLTFSASIICFSFPDRKKLPMSSSKALHGKQTSSDESPHGPNCIS